MAAVGLSTKSPGTSWRRGKAAVGAAVLGLVAVGVGWVGAASPAYADVTSASYNIGAPTPSVSGLVVAPTIATVGASTNFNLSFVASVGLSTSGTITVRDSTSGNSVVVSTSKVQISDSAGTCLEPAPASATSSGGGLTVTLGNGCTVTGGDTVTLDLTATAPLSSGSLTFDVTTSGNATPALSNPVTLSIAPPAVAAASAVAGANTTYSIDDVPVTGLSSGGTSLVVVAKATGGSGTVAWYNGPSGYSVTFVASGGGATATDVVGAATVSTTVNPGDTVTLALATSLASGYTVNITAEGTNPVAVSTDDFTVTAGNGTPETTSNDLVYGSTVTNVLVSASPAVAGSSATYAISFKATTAVPMGDDIFFSEPNTDFSHVTGILVTDANQGWYFIGTGAALSSGGATVPLSKPVLAGDAVTVELVNVTNPSVGSINDFAVSTTADNLTAVAAPYTITGSGVAGVGVAVNPTTPAALATYTVSNLSAGAALVGGASAISLTGPTGTVFPNNRNLYTLEDSTTLNGSGTVSAPLVGGGSNAVTMIVPNNISRGDRVSLTVQDVLNPGTPGNYTISITGNLTSLPGPPQFPDANVAYPDAAIVSFPGTLYVFAGGHAFGVASPTQAQGVEAIDDAGVVPASAGAAVPTTAAVPGTLVIVYNNPTIYVVGTDGLLHGFATPAQFLGDGYDPADVITVPNGGHLGVGATAGSLGPAANALATAANGALIDSSGTFYVLAGGRAFGIASEVALRHIQAADTATPLSGTVGPALTGATIDGGTLLTVNSQVYVSYGGDLYPFKSLAQLKADGYGGTPSLPVPSTGHLIVELPYSGS
ncbi:MAG TPA: hypothetical protein VMS00_00530 [Acidimicrobiales bacterium]|nr:hypothetical protein [Acidimicrobiales bacterium]